MSFYVATPAPVLAPEVITAIVAVLEADATLQGALNGAGRVFDGYTPADKPADAELQWRRIVVREPSLPGGRIETGTRLDLIPILIVAEIQYPHSGQASIRPNRWLPGIHARIFALLVGTKPAFTSGTHDLPLSRYTVPSAPAFDADDGSFFSSAEFHAVVKPS